MTNTAPFALLNQAHADQIAATVDAIADAAEWLATGPARPLQYGTTVRELPRFTAVRIVYPYIGSEIGMVLAAGDGVAKVVWGNADAITSTWHPIFELGSVSGQCTRCDEKHGRFVPAVDGEEFCEGCIQFFGERQDKERAS